MQIDLEDNSYPPPRTIKLLLEQIKKYYTDRERAKLTKTFKQLYFTKEYSMISSEKWNVGSKAFAQYEKIDPLGGSFASILSYVTEYMGLKMAGKIIPAYQIHLKLVVAILKCIGEIQQYQYVWLAKPFRILLRATKPIFFAAYQASSTSSMSTKLKNDLLNVLQRYKGARSLSDDIKKQILPLIDIMQISILMAFHNYEQINRIIYTPKLYGDNIDKFKDNFLWQKGKYALINQNIKEAEECFEKIDIRTSGQKKIIMKYLIPCKIFLGKMYQPMPDDPPFPEYLSLIESLISSNFTLFQESLQRYQKVYLKRGLYLLIGKLRIIVWRNLIKKITKALSHNQITFQNIVRAVALAGGKQDINECMCIIGNLIYQGYIKGYIYQNQKIRTLVLKSHSAFPSLQNLYQ